MPVPGKAVVDWTDPDPSPTPPRRTPSTPCCGKAWVPPGGLRCTARRITGNTIRATRRKVAARSRAIAHALNQDPPLWAFADRAPLRGQSRRGAVREWHARVGGFKVVAERKLARGTLTIKSLMPESWDAKRLKAKPAKAIPRGRP